MQAMREFPARTAVLADARQFVSDAARELGVVEPELDDVVLLTDELVTNAVVHAGTSILIRVQPSGAGLRVEVHDGSTRRPVRMHPSMDALGGRGMMLVDTLAASWGVDVDDGRGKVVWFEVPCAGGVCAPVEPGTAVEVSSPLTRSWLEGFAVASVTHDGYVVRRVQDDVVLPATVPFDAVRLPRRL